MFSEERQLNDFKCRRNLVFLECNKHCAECIPAPNRQGKYRVYLDKDVVLIHMIRSAQAVGLN